MTLLLLEALLAMVLLIFIVWWTMFSGRKNGEIKPDVPPAPPVKHDPNGQHRQDGQNGPADKS